MQSRLESTERNLAQLAREQLKASSFKLADSSANGSQYHDEIAGKANKLILQLKSDVRTLSKYVSRLPATDKAAVLVPDHMRLRVHADVAAQAQAMEMSKAAEAVVGVVALEKLLEQVPLVPTAAAEDAREAALAAALDTVARLDELRGGLMAALERRLAAAKQQLDRDFGASFLDMQAFLRAEQDVLAAASDARTCGQGTIAFVQVTHQLTRRLAMIAKAPLYAPADPLPHNEFQLLAHAAHGLRAVREGLSHAVLLKQARAERQALAEQLAGAQAELRRIHHTYAEMLTPETSKGLANRQRIAIEELTAQAKAIRDENGSLKLQLDKSTAQQGRVSDLLADAQMAVEAQGARHGRELARLKTQVESMRARAEQLESLAAQSQTHIAMLHSANRRQAAELERLRAPPPAATAPAAAAAAAPEATPPAPLTPARKLRGGTGGGGAAARKPASAAGGDAAAAAAAAPGEGATCWEELERQNQLLRGQAARKARLALVAIAARDAALKCGTEDHERVKALAAEAAALRAAAAAAAQAAAEAAAEHSAQLAALRAAAEHAAAAAAEERGAAAAARARLTDRDAAVAVMERQAAEAEERRCELAAAAARAEAALSIALEPKLVSAACVQAPDPHDDGSGDAVLWAAQTAPPLPPEGVAEGGEGGGAQAQGAQLRPPSGGRQR
ncbi:hypothetical protein JKP88DRAFT_299276 [Tribonema minus]|uniref:Uncharacterized protein n=1 Tax=Tribonema minus TaxID=303371 RepID=A0A836CM21_9STRA|nr:hypothetical protein JKP88DRAFT_299276 [Tribonema minus]